MWQTVFRVQNLIDPRPGDRLPNLVNSLAGIGIHALDRVAWGTWRLESPSYELGCISAAFLPGSLDLQKCAARVREFCSAPCQRSGGNKEKWCCASGSRWRAARPGGISHRFPIAQPVLPEPVCNRSGQRLRCFCRSVPWCLFMFLPAAPGSARWGAAWLSKLGCVQGSYKLVRSC
jgi:hypothetical protein